MFNATIYFTFDLNVTQVDWQLHFLSTVFFINCSFKSAIYDHKIAEPKIFHNSNFTIFPIFLNIILSFLIPTKYLFSTHIFIYYLVIFINRKKRISPFLIHQMKNCLRNIEMKFFNYKCFHKFITHMANILIFPLRFSFILMHFFSIIYFNLSWWRNRGNFSM